jgi:hypothetical protein
MAKTGYERFQKYHLKTPKQDQQKIMSIPNMELCPSSGSVRHYAQKFEEEKAKLHTLSRLGGIWIT